MLRLIGRWATLVAGVLVAFVLAHDLVFLIGYGNAYRDALARTGHDQVWRTTVLVVLAAGAVLLLAAAVRLITLARDVRRARAPRVTSEPSLRVLLRLWLALAVALALVVAVGLVLIENVEHLRIGATLPGLSVLGSQEYPNALLVISAVSSAVGFVAALYRWRLEVLVARVQALPRAHQIRPTASARLVDQVDRRPGSLIGRRLAGRAPPRRDRRSSASPLVNAAA
jgi:hypothetical protein